ncbi:MAG: RNA polymerase factor sigma-54 [Alphaproteobacteria bacterium]|nr:RNA polymerase factor sigma-54 [Alphaproteobacteria bacterium]
MAIKTQLVPQQTVSPVVSPQMRQAIAMLQLSTLELTSAIAEEIERNPLLEWAEADFGASGAVAQGPGGGDRSPPPGTAATGSGRPNYVTALFGSSVRKPAAESGEAEGRGSGIRSGDPTLQEHLTQQLHEATRDPVDHAIGGFLIGNLDDAGYLRTSPRDAAVQLQCEEARVATVLERVQRFDPPGVFARDLAECLALQLEERGRLDAAMGRLIGNIDVLARQDRAALKRICEVDDDELDGMIAEILALDPKPGLAFDTEVTTTIVPDVFVTRTGNGEWRVELNSDTLPRLIINNAYRTEISRSRGRPEKSYIAECFSSANWLIKALNQRAETILKVASEIVVRQQRFLAGGVVELRPMVLRDVAAAIDLHESTVSRAANNKYMATPGGVFELKYFFSSSIARSDGGEAVSGKAVRHRIAELVANEDPASALSDARIAEILDREGIAIARRTVAKYRKILGLEPSAVRRRRKRTGPR